MMANAPLRIALVHDWLTGMRGGEKTLAAIGELFPRADLFTLIHTPGSCSAIVTGRRVITSGLNRLTGVQRYYRYLLPMMPMAIEQFDLRGYDLIVSSSHCVAKGIIKPAGALHLCYCHTPMRYVWDQQREYSARMSWPTRLAMAASQRYLKNWDRRSADRVDRFFANSHNVAQRISRCYGRESTVIRPPVDTTYFTPAPLPREDFYLVISALVPYKCIDHAVQAFSRMKRPLRVIGSGSMARSLRRTAASNIQFLGWQSDESVRDHYRRCRALIFPGEEDFGLTPLEAMACGTPVIAYGTGGALETVIDAASGGSLPPTGILYRPHTADALMAAASRFETEAGTFDPVDLRAWAESFGKERFQRAIAHAVETELAQRSLSAMELSC
jgi:glycosyltransferase involved in cell wall biosynthesis